MPDTMEPFFINYTFMCGFAVPLMVMAVCYFMLVRHVRRRFQERKGKRISSLSKLKHMNGVLGFNTSQIQRPRYMCELTKSIWRIAIFHFTCWAPFWFFTVSPYVAQLFNLSPPQPETWLVMIKTFLKL